MAAKSKLSVLGFGIASGITCGVYVLAVGLLATYAGWGTEMVSMLGSLYKGYEATLVGSLTGSVVIFVDCFIGGAVFAWLYNMFVK